MPSSAVRANMSSSRAAPSSMEYSVCTCRCTKESCDPPDIGSSDSSQGMTTDQASRLTLGLDQGEGDQTTRTSVAPRTDTLRAGGCDRSGPTRARPRHQGRVGPARGAGRPGTEGGSASGGVGGVQADGDDLVHDPAQGLVAELRGPLGHPPGDGPLPLEVPPRVTGHRLV